MQRGNEPLGCLIKNLELFRGPLLVYSHPYIRNERRGQRGKTPHGVFVFFPERVLVLAVDDQRAQKLLCVGNDGHGNDRIDRLIAAIIQQFGAVKGKVSADERLLVNAHGAHDAFALGYLNVFFY